MSTEREDELWEAAVNQHLANYLDFSHGKPFRAPCRERSTIDVGKATVILCDDEGRWLATWTE
jgi:hypothetical protein